MTPAAIRLAARVLDVALWPLAWVVGRWDASDAKRCDPFRGAPWNDDGDLQPGQPPGTHPCTGPVYEDHDEAGQAAMSDGFCRWQELTCWRGHAHWRGMDKR